MCLEQKKKYNNKWLAFVYSIKPQIIHLQMNHSKTTASKVALKKTICYVDFEKINLFAHFFRGAISVFLFKMKLFQIKISRYVQSAKRITEQKSFDTISFENAASKRRTVEKVNISVLFLLFWLISIT